MCCLDQNIVLRNANCFGVEKKLSFIVETEYGVNGPMKNAKLQNAATRHAEKDGYCPEASAEKP